MNIVRVKFYANRILTGRMTLDEVPEKYRADVEEYIRSL